MRKRLIFVLLLATALAPAAFGADCAKHEQMTPGFAALAALTTGDCLGGPDDEGPFTQQVEKEIEEFAAKEVKQLSELKRLVVRAAETLPAGQPEAPAAAMRAAAAILREEIEAGEQLNTGLLKPEVWDFRIDAPNLPNRPGGFDVRAFLEGQCQAGGPACTAAFAKSKEAVRFATLVARILGAPADLGQLLETLEARGKQWDAYFNQARSQYLWELVLNDRLTMKGDTRLLTAKGQPRGFREVPNRQFILLHPSVALEYVDDAADGEQFEEAAMVEVLGANWWKWKADGSMGSAFGLAVIATASDRASTDDLGWGLMLHFNHKYSLAVTDHDGDQGYLVTADLAKLWAKVSESRQFKLMTGKE